MLPILARSRSSCCGVRYAEAFTQEYERIMAAKLGLREYHKDLTQRLFQLMARHKVDFTNFFRQLSSVPSCTADGTLSFW